jgi:hypothetical protein
MKIRFAMLASVQAALVLGSIMIGAPSAWADSELQKFLASLPWPPGWKREGLSDNPAYPGALLFVDIESFITGTKIKAKNKNATFEEIEAAIFEECEREIHKADREADPGPPVG